MRIVHMTSVHRWDDPRIFWKMCRSLAEVGHEVHLVAPRPDGPEGETRHGVRIHAVPAPGNRRERIWRTGPLVWRKAALLDADVYHFHDPELIPFGVRLKAAGGRVVYDAHEDVPKQVRTKDWIPRGLRTAVSGASKGLQTIAARVLDGIVAATPPIARNFPGRKTALVRNYPLPDDFLVPDSLPVSKRALVVSYVGAITPPRGIREAMSAVALLPKSLQVRLALAGRFAPASLERELRGTSLWGHVDYRGWCSHAEIARFLAEARVGLVTLQPTANYVQSQPLKLFEYMSAGLPVVASDFPLWRRIVGGAGCGLLVDPRNPRAIAEAIQWLLVNPEEAERMGQRGRSAVARSFNWQQEFPVLLELYKRVVARPRQRWSRRPAP